MENLKQLGLIGYPLSHSFSKKYFGEKFKTENISGWEYDLYPIEKIELFPELLGKHSKLRGINVTIPYKEQVIPYLDEMDAAAAEIGAVNTIKITDGKLKGYNTDVYGFEVSLKQFISENAVDEVKKALILGTGGAAKAVNYVTQKLGIDTHMVSRSKEKAALSYQDLFEQGIQDVQLIINTTPLGMSPKLDSRPDIPYDQLSRAHLCYDLVYNPQKTVFLALGEKKGCPIKNGYEMLVLQAEKAWEIWTDFS